MKQEEMFDRLTNERCDEMQIVSQQINFNNLKYFFKTTNKRF